MCWTIAGGVTAPSSVPKLMALYGFRKLVCLLDDPWRVDDCPLLAFYESLLLSPDWYDGIVTRMIASRAS